MVPPAGRGISRLRYEVWVLYDVRRGDVTPAWSDEPAMSAGSTTVCPECGAPVAAGQARCWLCKRKASDAAANPYAAPRPTDENLGLQFSLASLFLVMTLVAVCLGVFMLAPGLGILLAVGVLPAMARTMIDVTQYKRGGAPLSPLGKIGSFLLSLMVVSAIGYAASVAFVVVCLAGALTAEAAGSRRDSMTFSIGLGACAAIAAAVGLFWITRPRSGLTN